MTGPVDERVCFAFSQAGKAPVSFVGSGSSRVPLWVVGCQQILLSRSRARHHSSTTVHVSKAVDGSRAPRRAPVSPVKVELMPESASRLRRVCGLRPLPGQSSSVATVSGGLRVADDDSTVFVKVVGRLGTGPAVNNLKERLGALTGRLRCCPRSLMLCVCVRRTASVRSAGVCGPSRNGCC